jgi:hypothetical protein
MTPPTPLHNACCCRRHRSSADAWVLNIHIELVQRCRYNTVPLKITFPILACWVFLPFRMPVIVDPHPENATGVCQADMIRCVCIDKTVLQISESFIHHSQLIDVLAQVLNPLSPTQPSSSVTHFRRAHPGIRTNVSSSCIPTPPQPT